MKVLFSLILVLSTSPIFAGSCGTNWTANNTKKEVSEILIRWFDYKQTVRFLKADIGHIEKMPYLGKHPSRARLINAGLGYLVTHTLLSYCVGAVWRRRFQNTTLMISSSFVAHNHIVMGVRIDY